MRSTIVIKRVDVVVAVYYCRNILPRFRRDIFFRDLRPAAPPNDSHIDDLSGDMPTRLPGVSVPGCDSCRPTRRGAPGIGICTSRLHASGQAFQAKTNQWLNILPKSHPEVDYG